MKSLTGKTLKNKDHSVSSKWSDTSRAVTVADFYHSGGNGPTTAGGALCDIYVYNSETQK